MLALDLGRVIAGGTPHEVVNHPAVVASYLGTSEDAIQRSGQAGAAAHEREEELLHLAERDRP